jgi:hypothetical protein
MATNIFSLPQLRMILGRVWLAWLFGIAYLVSQITILVIVEPLGSSFLELQCFGFSAERSIEIFRHWEEIGAMEAYRAHFALDDVHWVWYSVFFTVVLCSLFERRQIPHRFNWLLLLPLTSGLLDWYENQLQHVFLNSNDFSGVVDPLPLLSTLASVTKWTLALIYSVLTITLLARGSSRRTDKAAR